MEWIYIGEALLISKISDANRRKRKALVLNNHRDHPGVIDHGGSVTDFPDYVAFLEGLKSALEVAGDLGLSISIPSGYSLMKNFDIVTIAQVVDWVGR
jgi:GH18 family chitinase